jgi:phenylalanyl-tRNA synthetase beta chain
MLFSPTWIQEYLAAPVSCADAASWLNRCGLETEMRDGLLEVEHTVNRPDAMSHFGIARELSAASGISLLHPQPYEGEIPPLTGFTLQSESSQACPRYMALLVENLVAAESPAWLVERLASIGQKCHGLLVDLTNFLLWEMGHPSHAFDADKLEGGGLTVRTAEAGARLRTLDGRERDVAGLLCIHDGCKPVALAGVMGGENSEIDGRSSRLLLELAQFDPVRVRESGKRTQIHSDARHRFERGIDPEAMETILRRFLFLLRREQPQARVVGLCQWQDQPFRRPALLLRASRLERLLGIALPQDVVTELLQRMDMRPQVLDEGWHVQVPGYKVDVSREVDVIEEVIRFAGLDRLEASQVAMPGSDYDESLSQEWTLKVQETLRSCGLQEIISYSFISTAAARQWQAQGEGVMLANPLSETTAVLRPSLLPSMLDCLAYNHRRACASAALFEVGEVFDGSGERRHLALGLLGTPAPSWWNDKPMPGFFRLKGCLEALCRRMGWPQTQLLAATHPFFQPGLSFQLMIADRQAGWLGAPAQALCLARDLEAPTLVAELDLAGCMALPTRLPPVEAAKLHPAIEIDLAFVLAKSVSYQSLREHFVTWSLPWLEALELFDVFEGSSLGAGLRSLGLRFTFRAAARSLTREEVTQTLQEAVESAKHKFAAVIRS